MLEQRQSLVAGKLFQISYKPCLMFGAGAWKYRVVHTYKSILLLEGPLPHHANVLAKANPEVTQNP